MSRFLDLVNERVVVYDGATGTYIQGLGLTADDFGGPDLEGCNEILSVTRPDVIADLHEAFFQVGSDVVETNSFGAFAVPLGEYGIPERAHEISLASARIAREVADGYGGLVAGSMGPGTKSPSLGQIRFAELRDAYEVMARGLLEGGVDLLIIETHFDLLAAKAAVIGARRAMAAARPRRCRIQVQVTMELTGTMLLGTEIGAALGRPRRAAARRLRPQLRHRPGRDARAPPPPVGQRPHAHLVPPQRGPAVGGRRPDALRPHARAAGRVPDPVRHRARRAGGRRLLRHDARAPAPAGGGGQGPDARAAAQPGPSPAPRRSSARCRSTRTPAS